MIPTALQAGISLEQFWNYDFSELQLLFDAYDKKQKQLLLSQYNQAALTATLVGAGLSGKQFPRPHELWPEVFEAPDETNIAQAQIMAFAEQWNAKRRLKKDGDN